MVIFGSCFWQLGLLHTKKLIKCSQSVTQTKQLRISAVLVVWKFNSSTLITPWGECPILYAWSHCPWCVFLVEIEITKNRRGATCLGYYPHLAYSSNMLYGSTPNYAIGCVINWFICWSGIPRQYQNDLYPYHLALSGFDTSISIMMTFKRRFE